MKKLTFYRKEDDGYVKLLSVKGHSWGEVLNELFRMWRSGEIAPRRGISSDREV